MSSRRWRSHIFPTMKLKDKAAIVTGGGRGIGRAIAEAFAREGAKVIVTAARQKREIEDVASRIGGTAALVDVANEDAVQRLVDSVVTNFSGIDILVNNAARGMKFVNESFMTEPIPFWKADPDMWRMVVDTNINSVFLMTRAVIPHMLKHGTGRIINVSINQETMKRKGFSPYGPSKAALESMSTIWAQELQGTGITLNVLLRHARHRATPEQGVDFLSALVFGQRQVFGKIHFPNTTPATTSLAFRMRSNARDP
jgi:NAD(P)-dependent dehydrogenase (short-subunit alcohol dehydrogenase family)